MPLRNFDIREYPSKRPHRDNLPDRQVPFAHQELRQQVADMRRQIDALRAELKSEIAQLRAETRRQKFIMRWALGATVFGLVTLVLQIVLM